MDSLWNDAEAQRFVDRDAPTWGEDLALRVYTSRLIGRDESLVLHGGGNTSVKTTRPDVLGDAVDVLCVKGSGWDLGSIEPPGLPAVELEPLRRLRALEELTDEDMVNQLRIRLLEAKAPTPSIETLLHAFLPHRFVDHTHADAILVLTNQPDGEQRIRDALGDDVPILPWIMPGFPLAKAVADAVDAAPDCRGVVLLKHGIFTFADTARESYERMIDLVDRAERAIVAQSGRAWVPSAPRTVDVAEIAEDERATAARVLPIVRGQLALRDERGAVTTRWVADWRFGNELRALTSRTDLRSLCDASPLTPDHVIRTKPSYLVLSPDEAGDPERARSAVAAWADAYRTYFADHEARMAGSLTMLDPHPRVVVVEGLGLIGFGADAKAAGIAADIAEHTLYGKAAGADVGSYEALPRGELFEMEYWSLEQAKLGKKQPPAMAGRVALVTGAAGAIGHGIACALLDAGAHVFVTDVDADRLDELATALREHGAADRVASAVLDVTDPASVEAAFARCCLRYGGVDVVVPNAGIAWVGTLEDMDAERFGRVVDVNLTGTMTVLREAARVFRRQASGGSVVLQASKNVFDPGAGFGAYSASKAGSHQLGKIAALELASLGVRVNMINADAVFGDDRFPSGLWETVGPDRMRVRNLDPDGLREYYRQRSLLKTAVEPEHVGRAVVFFASEATPTTGATLPVDGGLPGAFPR